LIVVHSPLLIYFKVIRVSSAGGKFTKSGDIRSHHIAKKVVNNFATDHGQLDIT